jgi:hypothetical protein
MYAPFKERRTGTADADNIGVNRSDGDGVNRNVKTHAIKAPPPYLPLVQAEVMASLEDRSRRVSASHLLFEKPHTY